MPCFTELNRNVNKTKKDCQLILFLNEPTVLFVCVAYLFYFHSVNGYKYPASNAAYSDSVSCYITDIAVNTEVLI